MDELTRYCTAQDEAYSHQLVAPRLVTAHRVPTWAERCYHVVHVDEQLMLNAGRAVYPYAGRRTAFMTVWDGEVLHAHREIGSFELGDDPDAPQLGAVRIEVVRPMKEIRLVLEPGGGPLAVDLTYEPRGPAIGTQPNVIELDGRVVTDYMNFFQSGAYSGVVSIDGVERRVRQRVGFRDRGWGIRKHEGGPRRGLVIFGALEFPDATLHMLLYESASGRRAFTDGWLVDGERITDKLVGVEHDLELDGTLLRRGAFELTFASGERRHLVHNVDARLFLAAGGYSAEPGELPVGYARHAVGDPEVVARLDGQNDNGGTCRLDGVEGHGFIETGIGVHARYRPQAPAAA